MNKRNQKGFVLLGIVAIVTLTALVGGGLYVYTQSQLAKDSDTEASQAASPKASGSTSTKSEPASTTNSEFIASLESCAVSKTTFTHPFTGDELTKEIKGIQAGVCVYVEQMPNNGLMTCKYSEGQRAVAAKAYKDQQAAEGGSASASTGSGGTEAKSAYIVDGKEITNPLQTFLNDGTCVVSGY